MSNIKNSISLQDKMSPILNKMAKAMQSNLNLMEKLNRTSNKGITGKAFEKAQKDINSANNALIKFQNGLKKTKQNSEELGNSTKGLGLLNANALMGIADKTGQMVSGAADYLDNMALAKARIDMINDGTQTTEVLQNKILASSNRARMSYDDMLKSVAKLNLLAKEQFSSNDEAMAFVETLNKMFKVSGTSGEEASSAMYQLNQAMAAGKLQGDEFRSVMENAPMLADAIAKEMGKSKGELKELSSDGVITADIIKNAMFNYADEVEARFSTMPMTFGQKMQQVSNMMMKALEPVASRFSEWLNSDTGQKFFNGLITGVVFLANVIMVTIDIISSGVSFLIDIFNLLKPVIIFLGILFLVWAITQIPLLYTAIGILALTIWDAVIAAWQWAISLIAVNWPILLIAIAIAILIFILSQLGVTFADVVGFIVGLLYTLAAIVYNIVVDITNPFLIFANFLRNLFIDPVGAIKMMFLDMATFIIDQIRWVAKGLEDLINLIPGVEVNMTAGLDRLTEMAKAAKARVTEETGVQETKLLEHKDLGDAASKGFNVGSNFVNNIGDKFKGISDFKDKLSGFTIPDASSFAKPTEIAGGKVDEVGKIKGDVNITDEDIKLLKDIAATKFINSYTTLRPELKVEFSGPINETADTNKIMSAIEDMVEEAMANTIVEEVS
jgi:tape measure domain-containing protein